MKNYVVVVDRLYSYKFVVQAASESGAELLASVKVTIGEVEPCDFNESIAVLDAGEVNQCKSI